MRRVIIGANKEGKSAVLKDGENARFVATDLDPQKGHLYDEIWATDGIPVLPGSVDEDPTVTMTLFTPPPGGTRCRVLVHQTEKVQAEMFKLAAERGIDIAKEFKRIAPGFDDMDLATGMHTTYTIDYGYFISGQIDLELDDGKVVHFKAGDSYVLKGTRHAWHNRYDEPCIWIVFMIGTHKRS